MSNLNFSDGMSFDTSGDFRIILQKDGYYVVGNGWLIPVEDRKEGNEVIADMVKSKTKHSER